MKVLQVAAVVMGRLISCRVWAIGNSSSVVEDTFLPQPVTTELSSLKFSPRLGRQTGVWTLGGGEMMRSTDLL